MTTVIKEGPLVFYTSRGDLDLDTIKGLLQESTWQEANRAINGRLDIFNEVDCLTSPRPDEEMPRIVNEKSLQECLANIAELQTTTENGFRQVERVVSD